jgi:RNase P/RNase MRP subunit POP5
LKLRKRYVVLRFEGELEEVCELLRPSLSHPDFLKPILRDGDLGILRCAHLDLETVKRTLNRVGIRVVGVSGILRRARRKYLGNGLNAGVK